MLLALGAVLLLNPARAAAHALLLGSDPMAGTVLLESPPQVALLFSEAISPQFSSIIVLDRSGAAQQMGGQATSADGRSLQVVLRPNLAPGNYAVVWRVVSLTDGHLSEGNFSFTVAQAGQPVPTPAAIPGLTDEIGSVGNSPDPAPLRWLLRAIILLSLSIILGGALFIALLLEGAAEITRAAGRKFARLGVALALVLALALLGDMALQLGELLTPGADLGTVAGQFIGGTEFGRYWQGRLLCAVVLAAIFAWIATRRITPAPQAGIWNAAVAVAATFAAAEALSSHGAALRSASGVPVGLISDALHLVTVGAWIGGLFFLGVVLLPLLHRQDVDSATRGAMLGRLVPRFSRLAVSSIILLVGTGVINLALHTLDPQTVVTSSYGQVLIVKHLLFLPLLVLSLMNNRSLKPLFIGLLAGELDSPAANGASRRFAGLLRAEMALAAAVVLCAAGLTLLPPPVVAASTQTPVNVPVAPLPTVTPGPVSGSQLSHGIKVEFETTADPLGDRFQITLNRRDNAAPALNPPLRLQLRITPQEYEAGTTVLTPHVVGAPSADTAVFTATEPILTLAGGYIAAVQVQRGDGTALLVAFRLDLHDDGSLTVAPEQAIQAVLSTAPSPAMSGTVTLNITLLDGDAQPISGANVGLTALMPVHGHVVPDIAAGAVAGQPGHYRAQAQLQMGGAWLVIIAVDRPGQPAIKTDASLDVIDPGATPTAAPP